MSRRPLGAAPDDARPKSIHRRGLVTAIALAPAVVATPGAAAFLAPGDPAIAGCDAWLALQAEVGRLTLQWARRETWLVEHRRWFQLSENERRALPEAQDLYRIDARLPALYSQSHRLLARLPGLSATSLPGIARKAAVAVAAISVEDHRPEHLLLKSIVRDIAAL
jgi:hypothetical protein